MEVTPPNTLASRTFSQLIQSYKAACAPLWRARPKPQDPMEEIRDTNAGVAEEEPEIAAELLEPTPVVGIPAVGSLGSMKNMMGSFKKVDR